MTTTPTTTGTTTRSRRRRPRTPAIPAARGRARTAAAARAKPRAGRRPFRRPVPVATVLTAWAVFLVVFTSLAVQLRTGHAPVLSAAAPKPAVTAPRAV